MADPAIDVGSITGSNHHAGTGDIPAIDVGEITGSPPPPERWGTGRTLATVGATGTLAGTAAWTARAIIRKAFPGFMPTTSFVKKVNDAIRKSDSSSSFPKMWGDYMGAVRDTRKPMSFADYAANLPGHEHTVDTIRELQGQSKNLPEIESRLQSRGAGQKNRFMQDLANGLGIQPETISSGLEKLKREKSLKAEPLYAEAFKDKEPIRDTNLLDLFGTDTPNMAMMNALQARLKTLSLKGKEPPTLLAADPARRDAWKRLTTAEVPEQMFTGDEWRKLREYYAPGIEDLHHMRRNLWDKYQQALKGSDTDAASAYKDAWVNVTNYLDKSTSGAYQKARQAYKGDSDVEAAFETGTKLLKMSKDEVREAIKGMGSAEREGLSRGFYAGLEDMDQQALMREMVRRKELYPETRDVLGAVFSDKAKLDQFMKNIEGESAITESAKRYGSIPASKDAQPRPPYARVSQSLVQPSLKMNLIDYFDPTHYLGWPSTRAARRGTDTLFREPMVSGNGAWHPDEGSLFKSPRRAAASSQQPPALESKVPLSFLEQAGSLGRWAGAGAGLSELGYGGLQGYNAINDNP